MNRILRAYWSFVSLLGVARRMWPGQRVLSTAWVGLLLLWTACRPAEPVWENPTSPPPTPTETPAPTPLPPEICDFQDNDGDGQVDEGFGYIRVWPDSDGDGFGDSAGPEQEVCQTEDLPEDTASNNLDCDDEDPDIHPGASEVCNDVDDDCDGRVDDDDDDVEDPPTWYVDSDGDGYGTPESLTACDKPATGYADTSGDCDDTYDGTYPQAPEQCDEKDNDCDGVIDDNVVYLTWYLDYDGDGFGTSSATQLACKQPPSYVSNSTDCNDFNPDIHPYADEVCNNIDDNCSSEVDEDLPTTTWYYDEDGDGYGIDSDSKNACSRPEGYAQDKGDCNDAAPTIHPGASETCNGKDDNCDSQIDDGVTFFTWYRDSDGDGYGTSDNSMSACARPTGYVSNSTDCNDGAATVNPAATEICNGVDDDCDSQTGDGCRKPVPSVSGAPPSRE